MMSQKILRGHSIDIPGEQPVPKKVKSSHPATRSVTETFLIALARL